MGRVIVIGGKKVSFRVASLLHRLGEEVVGFFTRPYGALPWPGEPYYAKCESHPILDAVPTTFVTKDINDHVDQMRELRPDVIFSVGWGQIFRETLRSVSPVLGVHDSLLPIGAGLRPLQNAITLKHQKYGISLFHVRKGLDRGPLVAQLQGKHSPSTSTIQDLRKEAIGMSEDLVECAVRWMRKGWLPSIPQDMTQCAPFQDIVWERVEDPDIVRRANDDGRDEDEDDSDQNGI